MLRGILAEPGCIRIGGPSDKNPHNGPVWLAGMRERYAGTRLERQELDGDLLTDNPGALWTEALLERCRVRGEGEGGGQPCTVRPEPVEGPSFPSEPATEEQGRASTGSARTGKGAFPPAESTPFHRLVIAVDPPTGDGTCGIIACARDKEGRAHVLADHSVANRSPEGWAEVVAAAAHMWTALCSSPSSLGEGDHPKGGGGVVPNLRIVAESNQGGKMVRSVIRIADPKLRVKLVPAVQGKTDRAAPVAMLFEAGRVVLHGRFPELEAQLCGMIAGGDYEGPGNSPDRADAMVWALTELMLKEERGEPRIRML